MKPEQIKDEISQLALADQILLVESVWDAIAVKNSDIPLPVWQKQELDRRYKLYRKGEMELHGWEAVHEDIRKQYK